VVSRSTWRCAVGQGHILGLLGHLPASGLRKDETVYLGKITSKGVKSIMNFLTWLFKRIKDSMFSIQFGWIKDYRRMILREKILSIVLTLACGALYILLVGFLLIPFIDRADTFANTIWGLAGSVVMFYVYHWIMALHEVYLLERQKTWDALARK
jgi:hypothetical protein